MSIVIPVAFAINDGYLNPLLVALVSMFEHAHAETVYAVHVINYKLKPASKERIKQLINERHPQSSLTFLDLTDEQWERVPAAGGNYNKEVNYRLLLPELLPTTDKVLYMDVDILILSDLTELFSLNVENQALLFSRCIHDIGYVMDCVTGIAKCLAAPLVRNYKMWGGNSGVLLMNLELWRKLNWVEDSLLILRKAPKELLFFPDQAAINYLMIRDNQHKHSLPWSFNADPAACFLNETGEMMINTDFYKFFMIDEFVDLAWKNKQKVQILHFFGCAPWKAFNTPAPFRELYITYATKIGWHLPPSSSSSIVVRIKRAELNISNWVRISGKKVPMAVGLGFGLGLAVAGLLVFIF